MERRFDTSITRIRPFFQPLLRRDPSGESWLPQLLLLGQAQPRYAKELVRECKPLLDWVSRPRMRPDRALRQFGIPVVALEECFEHRLPPPVEFLRWLIENPSTLTWTKEEITVSPARLKREELLGHHGPKRAADAKAAALAALDKFGALGAAGKWWAFEGCTIADCLLETPTLLLLIEGKRAEPLSSATRWYPQRHQVLRNLETLRAEATRQNKEYAVMLMAEEYIPGVTLEGIEASLPHLPVEDRFELARHYLGCVTWSEALACVYFPHTVADAARRMRDNSMHVNSMHDDSMRDNSMRDNSPRAPANPAATDSPPPLDPCAVPTAVPTGP